VLGIPANDSPKGASGAHGFGGSGRSSIHSERSFAFCGHGLRLPETTLQSNMATGAKIWCSAKVLAQFLEKHSEQASNTRTPTTSLAGKTVVELGCGAGLTGICAALLGAKVVLTDLPSSLELAKQAVRMNKEVFASAGVQQPLVQPLEWGNQEQISQLPRSVDLILAADVVFKQEHFHALVVTIRTILTKRHCETMDAPSSCLIAYKRRHSSEEWFFSELQQTGFQLRELECQNAENVKIFLCLLQPGLAVAP